MKRFFITIISVMICAVMLFSCANMAVEPGQAFVPADEIGDLKLPGEAKGTEAKTENVTTEPTAGATEEIEVKQPEPVDYSTLNTAEQILEACKGKTFNEIVEIFGEPVDGNQPFRTDGYRDYIPINDTLTYSIGRYWKINDDFYYMQFATTDDISDWRDETVLIRVDHARPINTLPDMDPAVANASSLEELWNVLKCKSLREIEELMGQKLVYPVVKEGDYYKIKGNNSPDKYYFYFKTAKFGEVQFAFSAMRCAYSVKYDEYLANHPEYIPDIDHHIIQDKAGYQYYEPIEEIEEWKRDTYYLRGITKGDAFSGVAFHITSDEEVALINKTREMFSDPEEQQEPPELPEPKAGPDGFLDFETWNALLGDAMILYPFASNRNNPITMEDAEKIKVGMSLPEVIKVLNSRGEDEDDFSLIYRHFEISGYGYLVVYADTDISPESREYDNFKIRKAEYDENGDFIIRERRAEDYQEFIDALMTLKVTKVEIVDYDSYTIPDLGREPGIW